MRLGVGILPQKTPLFRFLIVATTAVLLPLFLFSTGISGFAKKDSTVNRYNIVLVTDASLSMQYTDPEGQRYEAIGKFIAQSTERGNYVGSVVFNGEVPSEGIYTLSDAKGIQTKKAIVEKIQGVPLGSWTNIGLGLKTAVDMLGSGDKHDLPSIVLLLSDGKTDMPEGKPTETSKDQRDLAVETAIKNNIKIYVIGLNADGTMDNELSKIAKDTGGQFHEVKNAADLEPVFETFRQVIFNSADGGSNSSFFDATGTIRDKFTVAPIGVEEVNLSMPGITNANSGVYDYTVVDPNGKVYSKDALASQTYVGKRFITIKFTGTEEGKGPVPGDWHYTITGKPGDRITVDFAINSNLSAKLRIEPDARDYAAGDTVTVIAQLLEDDSPAGNAALHGYRAAGTLKSGRDDPTPIQFESGANDGEFLYKFTVEKSGSFTFSAEIKDSNGFAVDAGSVTINAGNKPPVPKGDIKKTIRLKPQSVNDASIDLRPGAADEQKAPLEYEVTSSTFAPDEYAIKGTTLEMYSKPDALKIGGYSRSNGSFVITAYDAEGASCKFNVRVKTVNVTAISGGSLAGIILAVLAAFLVSAWILKNKKFNGTCFAQLEDYAQGYQAAQQIKKARGNIKLSAFKVYLNGMDAGKCWFQASGKKDHAFFCSKKPVSMNGKMQKKIKLDGMFVEHVQIAPDTQSSAYIDVWFKSDFGGENGW